MRTEQGVVVTGQMPGVSFPWQTWFPGVTVLSQVELQSTPGCVLDAPGMCLGVGLSTQGLYNKIFACTHHHSLLHLKEKKKKKLA